MGREFKAIILSTWKVPCTLPGNCAQCIFISFFLLLLLFLFVFFRPGYFKVVHVFITFQRFVQASIACEG